jgi:peroxiredoxin
LAADPIPKPTRSNRWRGWLVNLLLIVFVFAAVQWWRARPLAAGEAPDLVGTTLDGQPMDLRSFRGQPVLVHFWATWCPVCRLGQGAIDSVARDHRVIGVAMQSGDAPEVARFMDEQGLTFPAVTDASGELSSQWGVPAVPASFVLDRDGRIAYSTLGFSTETGLRARLWAAGLGRPSGPARSR